MIVEDVAGQFWVGTAVFSFIFFLSLLVLGWIIGTKPKLFMTFVEKHSYTAFILLIVYLGGIASAFYLLFSGGT